VDNHRRRYDTTRFVAILQADGNPCRHFRPQRPEVVRLGQSNDGRDSGPLSQHSELIRATATQQAHRQPIELGEMIEVRVCEQDLVDHVDAVALLELQQRRHHAHAAVDERVPHDRSVLLLDERVRDVGLPIGIAAPAFVGPRAGKAELDAEGWLDAVDPQEKPGSRFIHGLRSGWSFHFPSAST
jgi:hypothetical protein